MIILQGIFIMTVVVVYQVTQRWVARRQLAREADIERFDDSEAAIDEPSAARPNRERRPARRGWLMDFGDLGAAIAIALTYFTIIYITGLGGLYSERSGIVNIGLEGMMIIGTVTGSWGTFFFTTEMGWGQPWGPLMGLLVGFVAGALFAGIHAVATITFRVDQIVSGVVINLVAIGLSRFLSQVFFGQATQSAPGQPKLNPIDIPLLSSLPLGSRPSVRAVVPDGGDRVPAGDPRVVLALSDPVGVAPAVLR